MFFDDDYDYLQHLKDTSKDSVQWIPVETGNSSNSNVFKSTKKEEDNEDSSDDEIPKVEVNCDSYLQSLPSTCLINYVFSSFLQFIPGQNRKQINFPSSVFASEIEEDVGLLNKAAPQSGTASDF